MVSDRVQGIIAPPERTLTIRNLLIPGNTASNGIEFVQETGFTNNAAAVAEGALKPKSDIKFELKSAPVRTIAHYFKASRQIWTMRPVWPAISMAALSMVFALKRSSSC